MKDDELRSVLDVNYFVQFCIFDQIIAFTARQGCLRWVFFCEINQQRFDGQMMLVDFEFFLINKKGHFLADFFGKEFGAVFNMDDFLGILVNQQFIALPPSQARAGVFLPCKINEEGLHGLMVLSVLNSLSSIKKTISFVAVSFFIIFLCIDLIDECVYVFFNKRAATQPHLNVYSNYTLPSTFVKPMPEDFSTRLRFARQLRGLSQASLGKVSELQPSAISHFETGIRAPSFDNLKRLADALNISSDYLIGRTAEPALSSDLAERILRHAEKLSKDDLDMVEKMVQTLAERKKVD
jgi:transcriptional regulator with XRE-family HTH domain